MPSLTAGQIQAQVASIRKRVRNGSQVYAMRTPEPWTGPDRLMIDEHEHLIRFCLSDLQAREALLLAEETEQPMVLLFADSAGKLEDDVVSRFAKQRVFAPKMDEVLASLFSARIVDPRVRGNKALCEALIDCAPGTGYAPVTGGTLDLQTAWTAVIERMVGDRMDSPSLNQILEWSLDPQKIDRLAAMSPALREAFVDWFARTRGEAIRYIFAAMDAGLQKDVIPLGMALGQVFSPAIHQEPEFHAARARLEKYFGGREIDPESARTWCRAAEASILPLSDHPHGPAFRSLLNRVDHFLGELKLLPFAWLSNYSPSGLVGRFERLGASLQKALKSASPATLEAAQQSFAETGQHVLAKNEPDRIERAEMALRLIRWLQSPALPATSAALPDLAAFYVEDGGFLDWARNRLRESDVAPALQTAYEKILRQCNNHLDPVEKRFTEELAGWTREDQTSNRLLPIEDVLQQAIIPLAKENPVLLLVLDGMSVAVFRQLVRDIERQNWSEIGHSEWGLPAPVLAALPSITEISRRALFAGKLEQHPKGTEKSAFTNNDFLFKASGSQVRPQLFLKGDLQGPGSSALSSEVRSALEEKKCRVVGLVVNAIDDHLDSGDQVIFTWGLDRIRLLREILGVAAESGRTVIMTSDHGHVLDFGTKKLGTQSAETGDRYHLDADTSHEGEMIFEGPRVLRATGRERITLAHDANIRYAGKKRGYHGGAHPQEMVVPLAILRPSSHLPPSDWQEIASYEPDWWRAHTGAPLVVAPPRAAKDEVKGLELFDQVAPAKGDRDAPESWIERVLASVTYQEQSKLAVRGGPAAEVMTAFLRELDQRGGSVLKTALAQALGVPLFRVDGLVQNISRILNVDGYDVLAFDRASETITLNIQLLKSQFEVT